MATGISTLGQSLSQINSLKRQQFNLSDLQLQLSSGNKTTKFSGLKTEAIISKRARAEFNAIETYTNNIKIADRRLQQMVTSIEELQAQAGNVANIIAGEIQEGEIDIQQVNDLTKNIIPFLEDLINAQDNERYVFGGAASTQKPLSLSSGTLSTFLKGELKDWQAETLTTDDLIASYRGITDNVIGYNAQLSDNDVGNISVRADKSIEIDYTTFGNADGFRDIMIAVQALQELTVSDTSEVYHIEKIKLEETDYEGAVLPTDLPQTPPPATSLVLPVDFEDPLVRDDFNEENQLRADNFFKIFNDLGLMINRAIDDLDQLRFSLESDRARLSEINDQHLIDKATVTETISDIETVDITDVAIKLNFLQVQLEASYRVTASISNLTLSNFL